MTFSVPSVRIIQRAIITPNKTLLSAPVGPVLRAARAFESVCGTKNVQSCLKSRFLFLPPPFSQSGKQLGNLLYAHLHTRPVS